MCESELSGFLPYGEFIVINSNHYTVKLWEKSTGNILKYFEGHHNWVMSVVFSPDGGLFVSGFNVCIVILWERSTGNLLKSFEGHNYSVN